MASGTRVRSYLVLWKGYNHLLSECLLVTNQKRQWALGRRHYRKLSDIQAKHYMLNHSRTAVVEAAKNHSKVLGNAVIFFYCQTTGSNILNACDVFESLTQQLLMFLDLLNIIVDHEIKKEIQDLYRYGGPQRDLEDILKVFSAIVDLSPGTVCMIDGLDDLDYEASVAILEALRELIDQKRPLRLFISSRRDIHRHISVPDYLPNVKHIDLVESDNALDIEAYVDNMIADKSVRCGPLSDDAALIATVKSELRSKSHGM